MNPADTIRFLHHQASECRDRDEAEALCLLLPALLRVHDLPPMGDAEAAAFKFVLKETLDLATLCGGNPATFWNRRESINQRTK